MIAVILPVSRERFAVPGAGPGLYVCPPALCCAHILDVPLTTLPAAPLE